MAGINWVAANPHHHPHGPHHQTHLHPHDHNHHDHDGQVPVFVQALIQMWNSWVGLAGRSWFEKQQLV